LVLLQNFVLEKNEHNFFNLSVIFISRTYLTFFSLLFNWFLLAFLTFLFFSFYIFFRKKNFLIDFFLNPTYIHVSVGVCVCLFVCVCKYNLTLWHFERFFSFFSCYHKLQFNSQKKLNFQFTLLIS
jgi:hypothetical protein